METAKVEAAAAAVKARLSAKAARPAMNLGRRRKRTLRDGDAENQENDDEDKNEVDDKFEDKRSDVCICKLRKVDNQSPSNVLVQVSTFMMRVQEFISPS